MLKNAAAKRAKQSRFCSTAVSRESAAARDDAMDEIEANDGIGLLCRHMLLKSLTLMRVMNDGE